VLLSTPLHASSNFTVSVQLANKRGLKKLGRKSSGSGLESREYDRKDPSRSESGTINPQKLSLTSPTSSGLSVGILRSRTQAKEFSLVF
jgi:hypothetical protein